MEASTNDLKHQNTYYVLPHSTSFLSLSALLVDLLSLRSNNLQEFAISIGMRAWDGGMFSLFKSLAWNSFVAMQ